MWEALSTAIVGTTGMVIIMLALAIVLVRIMLDPVIIMALVIIMVTVQKLLVVYTIEVSDTLPLVESVMRRVCVMLPPNTTEGSMATTLPIAVLVNS